MAFSLGENLVFQSAAGVSIASTGDKLIFAPVMPISLFRWGVIATVVFGGAPVLAMDKRITAGSDTGRVAAAGGVMTPGAVAVGKGAYRQMPVTAGAGMVAVDPGEELVMEVTTAATSTGTAHLYIEYIPRAFQPTRNSNMAKKTA